MTDRVAVPFLMWSYLLDADGGPCMARTRAGSWCKHPIFTSAPRVEYDVVAELVFLDVATWERWMDGLCPTHRRGRWLDEVRARRAEWAEAGS